MSVVTPTGDAAVMPRFPVLDTLRAIGALAVLTTHTAFWGGEYTRHGAVGTALARLDVGVAIFFVLSGFLLSYPYLARARRGLPAPSLRPYLWKRFLRIYPVYLLTAVLALLLIDDNRGAPASQWLSTLLLGDIYVRGQLPQGLTQMWSLSVEVSFYLALPLLMILATGGRSLRARRCIALVLAMTLVGVAWHLVLSDWLDDRVAGSPLLWLPSYLTWFALGIAFALARVLDDAGAPPGRVRRGLTTLAGQPGACWAAVLGLLLVAATPIAGPSLLAAPTAGQSLVKNLLYAAVGALVVLTGAFGTGRGVYARVFSFAPLRHLGHISFSVFCLHLPVLHLVMWMTGYERFEGHGWQIWLLTLTLSVGAAEVVYRWLERPAMSLRRLGGPTERVDGAPDNAKTPATDTSRK
jgi:peptidoglycan/LPS O-acetylase OafA/YrhL